MKSSNNTTQGNPTYKHNRYGQGIQDAESLFFKTKPTIGWLQRFWLKLTSTQYSEGFKRGKNDATKETFKQHPEQPYHANTDTEMITFAQNALRTKFETSSTNQSESAWQS